MLCSFLQARLFWLSKLGNRSLEEGTRSPYHVWGQSFWGLQPPLRQTRRMGQGQEQEPQLGQEREPPLGPALELGQEPELPRGQGQPPEQRQPERRGQGPAPGRHPDQDRPATPMSRRNVHRTIAAWRRR